MGDRVEERMDEQRLEMVRQNQKATESRGRSHSEEFQKLVAVKTEASQQEGRKDQSKQQDRGAADDRINVRQGLAQNQKIQRAFNEAGGRQQKSRASDSNKEKELTRNHEQFLHDSAKDDAKSIGLRAAPQRVQTAGEKRKRDDDGRQGQESRRELAIMGLGSQGGLMPLSGVGARQASGSAGATQITSQQIIDQIVKTVHHGVTAEGLGLMHIQLKEDVLAGASLSIQASKGGQIQLNIHTGDPDVIRLLSSGETAHELAVALGRKAMTLKSLEVNDNKVVG